MSSSQGYGRSGEQDHLFQGTREQKSKNEGTISTVFLGTGNIKNQDFDLGEQGKMLAFQGNKGTGTPTPRRASGVCTVPSANHVHLGFCRGHNFNTDK